MSDAAEVPADAEKFLEWLDERIEDSRESYNRDTNPRHTNIALGKLRAYNHVRERFVYQLDGELAQTGDAE